MAGLFARMFSVLALMLLVSAAPASAGDNASVAPEIRATIERQFDAFARDDAAGAYEFAAPGIKAMFADPGAFIAVVRGKYAPVYRHRSVEFGDGRQDGDTASQMVTIVDEENRVWKALYDLARQPDGTWLITGCVLVRSADSAT